MEYQRAEEGFAYVVRGSAHVMLEQQGVGRNWVTGVLERPLGRGINFQISVPDLALILSALAAVGYPLFMEPESKWYRISPQEETGVEQFLVADPDGYLIRFQSPLGRRAVVDSSAAT
ncbi:hypothetical protein [Kribbella sp. NPDC000426]|uniref:hypothetical protein n=1 Tax=Kribbella sp. NPDC000426 TaxID=3154255 RepID=UPI00331EDF80